MPLFYRHKKCLLLSNVYYFNLIYDLNNLLMHINNLCRNVSLNQ